MENLNGSIQMTTDELKEKYQETFHANDYSQSCIDLLEQSVEMEKNLLSIAYDMLRSAGISGRLLEISSGPTIQFVLAASPLFTEIILSDYVKANREALKKWLKETPDAFNWNPILKLAAEIEGYSNADKGAEDISQRIRKAVKKVIPCDITSNDILEPIDREKPFDCILSSLTLEAAATNYESYVKQLKNLNKLLRPGGVLLLKGVTKCVSYEFGNTKFPCLPLTLSEILEAVHDAGFKTLHLKAVEKPECMKDENFDQIFVSCHFKPSSNL